MPDRTTVSSSVIPDLYSKNFDYESVCLEIAPFTGTTHSSANIAEMLKHDLLHKWHIENKVHLVVCDNAANMVCATGTANMDHIPLYSTYSAIGDQRQLIFT
ncbi:hypothetical protein PR048_016591 [Dryococelus australis]|uniref:Transposase n=1 Tax=Dryococelus australis TaxID=614101 RepID=A0ABQ9H753_9NEOP|nr:hypothetical protein PR048_016591 [Dryococelus australis]